MDEIGELPPAIQKSLLRTLQERRVRPVGSKKEEKVDFRLVAATNRNLDTMVQSEDFRSDLLFRIRGIEIKLPPLRQRIEDIRNIASHKILQLGNLYGFDTKGVSIAFFEVLEKYNWPGNIRELMNVLEHSIANSGDDPMLVPIHLPPKYRVALIAQQNRTESSEDKIPDEKSIIPEEGLVKMGDFRSKMDKMYLLSLKAAANGDWRLACDISGLSKTRLYDLLKKAEISLSS